MNAIRISPLFLEFKDLIVVRISATNQIGESAFSEIITDGITVQT